MFYRSNRSNGARSTQNRGFGRSFGNRFPRSNRKKPDGDVSSYIVRSQKKDFVLPETPQVTANFTDFALLPQIQQSVAARGYTVPTPIQAVAIPVILSGKDLLGLANTGTGKTGAFLLPILDKILKNREQMTLIVAPTRELAEQINRELNLLTRGLNLYSVLCIGGTSLYRQKNELQRNHNFIIGTPGRLLDLINQRALNLNTVETVVLDEVDRMLDMGFVNDMRKLLQFLPTNRQSLFFSATVTPEIMKLIQQFAKDVETVSVKTQESTAMVEQDIVRVGNPEGKIEMLQELLRQAEFDKVLIFGRTKHGVQKLSKRLSERGFRADAIHGNKSQSQRQHVLTKFRQNRISILVATDVAARGLDIPDITHVINFDVPATYEDYIHRIGRTGRGDRKGKALTFVG